MQCDELACALGRTGLWPLHPRDVLRAWAIEERRYRETFPRPGFDLLPQLSRLPVPALVLHGDYDFVPLSIAREIAAALPNSRLVVLPDCGHFSYLEQPGAVRQAIDALFATPARGSPSGSVKRGA